MNDESLTNLVRFVRSLGLKEQMLIALASLGGIERHRHALGEAFWPEHWDQETVRAFEVMLEGLAMWESETTTEAWRMTRRPVE